MRVAKLPRRVSCPCLLDGTKPSVFNIAIQLGTDNDQNEEKDELPREKTTGANFVLFHTVVPLNWHYERL
jgi:hypothetical protein